MINTEGFSAMANVLALGALPALVNFVEGKVVCVQWWVGSGGYFGKGACKSEKGGLVASQAAGGRGLQVVYLWFISESTINQGEIS